MAEAPIAFPADLRTVRPSVDAYLTSKLRQFGGILARQVNPGLNGDQIRHAIDHALAYMMQQDAAAAPQRSLRLVIRHDCQSTGCGDTNCILCQYNPSRLCTRNVKQKYLIDDHLKAKCSAPLRVELVDDQGNCHTEGLPQGVQLELHVLNGEKYKELCPDNTLLSIGAIKNCIISHHVKALLRREGMSDDQLRVYLPLERGAATLSDLALTTSSEALLSGKAPTFRLLVWAVEPNGEPVPYVTYVVSESFVVATKRVKHAIKSDIPSVGDHISKLLHIGKATVDKLMDLRAAFQEEGFDVKLPDALVRVEKVGQFRTLVEMSEANNDLKNKLRHVLKLSPEKWDEVCQHALSAVVPDFRNRVWWWTPLRLGLLYQCKNGAIVMENPIGIVRIGANPDGSNAVVSLQSLSPADFNAIPKLKQQALQNWYMSNHPNWAIYDAPTDDGAGGPPAGLPVGTAPPPAMPPPLPVGPGGPGMAPGPGGVPGGPGGSPLMAGMGAPPGMVPPGMAPGPAGGMPVMAPGYGGADVYGGGGAAMQYGGPPDGVYGVPGAAPVGMAPGMGIPGMGMQGQPRASNSSPFALMQGGAPPPPQQQQPQGGSGVPASGSTGNLNSQAMAPQQPGPPNAAGGAPPLPGHVLAGGPTASGGSVGSAGRSAFAVDMMMHNIADAFPNFPGQAPPQQGAAPGQAPPGGAGAPQQGRADGVVGTSAGGAPPGTAPGAPHSAGGHHAQGPGSLMFPGGTGSLGIPSLEMLKTEELMDRGMSMFGGLTGNDTFRSTDWLQQLHGGAGPSGAVAQGLAGVNSYTMIDVAPGAGVSAGGALLGGEGGEGSGAAGQGPQSGGQAGQGQPQAGMPGGLDHERRLSLKLNSMSLDLDKVIAEHTGS
ncbi:hypothetical protein HYH02_008823 [Chlamydomonas schloesseri]|uniref:Uncharacterized protein n=1 Tax=Chlamydomonas schloesseri TaxID=2026947 RepID=A0A836B2D6_9CHLO|nr:hypothetical protein HYH02_008823 [Chlamydomonas schloesseri]|eukprot:KAG2445358.1 hypothetical protein HYH02_008823 [Chlamydomonas schloesseri]